MNNINALMASTWKLTTEARVKIVEDFGRLVPMVELAKRHGVSRMAIWKVLHKAGVDTSKSAAHISTSCEFCHKPLTRIRCRLRKQRHSFCDKDCWYGWLAQNPNEMIRSRQGMRMARQVVQGYFPLCPGMVVHHEDRNEKNNDPHNLRVFSCNADHISYHRGGPALPIWDGSQL